MFRIRRSLPEPRLELTPLVDVVFLLLTFFIFSMVLMVRADVLGIALPELSAGEAADERERIVIGVTGDGSVRLEGEPIEIADLSAAVVRQRDASPDAALIIAADRESRSGTLLRVLDALAARGITEFSVIGTPGAEPDSNSSDQPPAPSSSSNP